MALEQRQQWLAGLALWLMLAGTVLIYWDGLNGVFIFDDFVNLEKLSQVAEAPGWHSTIHFILDGAAGPTRRPVSLASFALQAAYWPQPWFFKYTNLILHLLNACLIAWLLLLTGRLATWPIRQTLLLTSFVTLAWLFSPMHVSTVLYVVQRMTELAAFFTLAGIVAYLYGRWLLTRQRIVAGFLCMSLGVGLGGMLAVFSKENGILLPLYILVLEATLLHKLPKPQAWRWWASLFLYAPLLMLLGYIAISWDGFLRSYSFREFTLPERLLTEARVLFEYLLNILLPRPDNLSLFHDDFPLSTGWVTPWTTLPAVFGILGALGMALALRRRYPVVAFGILWFLAGHALESNVLPLIIMFEHRNYLPMLGPLLATAYGFIYLYQYAAGKTHLIPPTMMIGATVWLFLMGFTTRMEVTMWHKPLEQALHWANNQPNSRIAQIYAAKVLGDFGRPDLSVEYYQRWAENYPEDTGVYLTWMNAGCFHPGMPTPGLAYLLNHFQQSASDFGSSQAIDALTNSYLRGQCPHLSAQDLEALFAVLLTNPRINSTDRAIMLAARAKLAAARGDYKQAIAISNELSARKGEYPELPGEVIGKMLRLAWLAEDKQYTAALSYIEQLRKELNLFDAYRYAEHLDAMENILTELALTYRKKADTDIESDPLHH